MPQENYNLIGFDWDQTLEELRKSSLIVGDLTNEGISQTKEVLCASVKIKEEKVSFSLSQYGKLQISSSNADFLRRAKSQLRKIITCTRWVPLEEKKLDEETGVIEYQSIMDLPEAKEADWSKIPEKEILRITQTFLMAKELEYYWLLDLVRTRLAKYAKSSNTEGNNKSLRRKTKELLGLG